MHITLLRCLCTLKYAGLLGCLVVVEVKGGGLGRVVGAEEVMV